MDSIDISILETINKIVPNANIDDEIEGFIDGIYFIEVIMQAEVDFNIFINEGNVRASDFKTVKDLMQWIKKWI